MTLPLDVMNLSPATLGPSNQQGNLLGLLLGLNLYTPQLTTGPLTPDPEYIISAVPRPFTIATLLRPFKVSLLPRPFTVASLGMQRFDTKDPAESVPLTFNFAPDLATGEQLSGTPSVSVSVSSGMDASPAAILNGAAGLDSTLTQVVQPVRAGNQGTEYQIVVTCGTTNVNKTLTLVGILPVRR